MSDERGVTTAEREELVERGEGRFRTPPAGPADALEQEVLAAWEAERLFERTLEARAGAEPFVFFEGPPTANGRPGIHHVFARTIKDLFCRHRAMQGYFVPRKAGWDTHGLPVEIEVEKRLGISGKQDIERVGVARFNELCRESVWTYRGDWERLSARIGYWLDYADPYVTYANEYVESVWWALRTLHERGLLYRGHKILPYCPRCETSLSSHEVAQGYEDVEDPSVYVALDLVEPASGAANARGDAGGPPRQQDALGPAADQHPSAAPGSESSPGRRILVWTTTPWTLVSNVALAVNPDLTYAEVRRRQGDPRTLVLAEGRLPGVLGADWADRWEVVARRPGRELEGWRYRRPIDWLPYGEGAHEIIVGESFVSAEDGSGVVHMAPAFGADDYAAGQRHGLAFLQPVDARGRFPADLPRVGGQFVKEADAGLIDYLREQGALWKASTFVHSYPHCWRCGTPLLYYARGSWFVRTTAVKDEMLARNARVDWHPEEMRTGRFGEWLSNNIDWAISRDRYWGTPLPVWVNDEDPSEIEVIGSYAELAERVGRALPADFDPHKPFIDEYSWPARSGRGTMRRVPEVIDAWFDSGSMPFAQWHYPFEHRELLPQRYPADFIAEGVDQTRGWFYSLLAIATGLGDALPANASDQAAPYRAVVVNDQVLDANGLKMSKSRGNIVNPWEVIDRHGVDAVRLFFVASSQLWVPRRFDEEVIRETAGRFLVTLRNVYGFFALYANFGWAPGGDDPPVAERALVDRWILSRLATVETEVDALLTRFDATAAARLLMGFVTDDLSNWYVRLTRPRYWAPDGTIDRAAFATLHEVLVVVCRLLAPIAPFVTDWMHRELTGRSVHLADYTRPSAERRSEPALERAMDEVRELARLGRAAREEAGLKVRQPLARLVAVVPPETPAVFEELLPLLAGELNVKQVELAGSADALVSLEAKANFRTLGKKFGKETPRVAQAVAAMPPDLLRALERGDSVTIDVDGTPRAIAPEDVTLLRRASGELVVQEAAGRFAAIDTQLSDALRREGLARELVSRVQRMRKDADFDVSDRIRVWLAGDATVLEAVEAHREWVAGEVLARELWLGERLPENAEHAARTVDLDGLTARVALVKD
ncbi:MAG TPA: isoleucine--tRNA ligase [Gemmatimonadaceae bacterium]|nr:isoleucine--tRNA ligase [Gemmatimonadaceae bacterium]